MILDGKAASEFITFGDTELYDFDTADQIQPNGVDLRVNKVYEMAAYSFVPRDGKVQLKNQANEVDALAGSWHLRPQNGVVYYVDFHESIYMPPGYCGILKGRSSLVRSGVDVMAGLWDTGFKGQLGCTLRVWAPITIEWGAKLCQLMVYQARYDGHVYDGRYQNTTSQTAIDT